MPDTDHCTTTGGGPTRALPDVIRSSHSGPYDVPLHLPPIRAAEPACDTAGCSASLVHGICDHPAYGGHHTGDPHADPAAHLGNTAHTSRHFDPSKTNQVNDDDGTRVQSLEAEIAHLQDGINYQLQAFRNLGIEYDRSIAYNARLAILLKELLSAASATCAT